MQAAAEDARAGLQAVQQERVGLQSQAACLRGELERLQDAKEAAEQVRPMVLENNCRNRLRHCSKVPITSHAAHVLCMSPCLGTAFCDAWDTQAVRPEPPGCLHASWLVNLLTVSSDG